MKADILTQTDWLVFPMISVVMFAALFVGVLIWVARPAAREVYAARGRMVLDDTREGGER